MSLSTFDLRGTNRAEENCPPSHRRLLLERRLMLLAIMLGVGCRLAQYLANRSYWGDEASLVLNIRGKTAWELLGPLNYAQAAPPLFLLVGRGLFRSLGGGEMSLRLLSIVCGIGSVLVFAMLSRRILPTLWGALAVLIFALSDRLIAHSAEVKPYIGDVFICTLFLWVAVGASPVSRPERRLAWLCVLAAIAVWFSFPSVIVFGAISLALMPAVVNRGGRGFGRFILLNLPVLASFAMLLLLVRKTQNNEILNDYWKDSFIDWRHPLLVPLWIARRFLGLCDYPVPSAGPGILLGAIVGAAVLLKGGRKTTPCDIAGSNRVRTGARGIASISL